MGADNMKLAQLTKLSRFKEQRIERYRQIIEELKSRNMESCDVAKLTGAHSSNISDLMRALVWFGVARVVRPANHTLGLGHIYAIADESRTAAFFDHVNNCTRVREERGEQLTIDEEQGRGKIHVLGDDEPVTVRRSRPPVRRDELVAALFGAPKTSRGAA